MAYAWGVYLKKEWKYNMIAILFDVDGTLVESCSFDNTLFIQTIKEVLGNDLEITDDWHRYPRVTATGILHEVMRQNGIEDFGIMGPIYEKFGHKMQEYLAENELSPKKGAPELLEYLRARSEYAVGIATGGWGHTAMMKLEKAGIFYPDIPLCSSNDGVDRATIMQKCLAELGDDIERAVYVGDGRWDMETSAKLGWGFIGVGPELKDKCKNYVNDFSDIDTFIGLVTDLCSDLVT